MNSSSTDIKDIRKFGLIAFLFFGILCAIGIWRQKLIPIYLFGLLSTLGIAFLIFPKPLRSIHQAWLMIAHFIGKVITIIMLSFAYYLIVTPSALIKRIFTGRPLPMSPNPDVKTYWVSREEPAQPRERFFKRY